MYPHTIEGLFAAVARGMQADVEEVVKSKTVDINQLHNGMHIINYILVNGFSQREEKIDCLTNAGAIPRFDEKYNTLFALLNLKDEKLRYKCLKLIKQAESFKDIYKPEHFNAMEGIVPQSMSDAYKTDYFCLYPIHYALKDKTFGEIWFKNFNYNFFKPIESGLYQGANLCWFIYLAGRSSTSLREWQEGLTPKKRYELLKLAPLNPSDSNYGATIAWLLLVQELFEDFTRLTQGLSAEQCYELLKSAQLYPNHVDYGLTVAHELLYQERYEDFTRLTQNLSAVQCYELLKSAPLNPNQGAYGITVALELLYEERYEDFTRLTQNLSAHQCFELLKTARLNPNHVGYGVTVALELLYQERFEDFTRLTQNLSAHQCYELLKSAQLNPNHVGYGVTVALELLYQERFEDFTRLTQNLSAVQCFELLKLAPLHPQHPDYSVTVAWLLIKHKRFADFEMLVKELSLHQLTELFSEVHTITSESPQKAEIKLTLLNYLAKENELLLIKILELYEANDLVEKLYDKLEKNNEGFDVVCYVIFQKCNISLRELMQSKSDQKEETKEIIKDYLKSLLDIYEQIAANSKYSSIANELVGMTISNACKTGYKQLFQDFFERLDAPDCRYMSDYKSIKSREPLNTLEGYGHYLRVLGCQNAEQAILLGIEHGEAKSGKDKLQKNDELLKPPILVTEPLKPPVTSEESNSEELESLRRQIQALKEENEKLKEKHSHTEQPVSNSEDEKNKELRTTRGDPRLFSTGVTPSNSISRPKRALEGVGLGQIPSRKRMG